METDNVWEVVDSLGKTHRFLANGCTPNGAFMIFSSATGAIVHIFYAPPVVTPYTNLTSTTEQ